MDRGPGHLFGFVLVHMQACLLQQPEQGWRSRASGCGLAKGDTEEAFEGSLQIGDLPKSAPRAWTVG